MLVIIETDCSHVNSAHDFYPLSLMERLDVLFPNLGSNNAFLINFMLFLNKHNMSNSL